MTIHTLQPFNETEQLIIDEARKSPMAWTVQTAFDQRNFLDFLKEVVAAASMDSEYRRALLGQ